MSGVLEPFQELTPDNRGPVVVVVSFNLIVITLSIAAIRVALALRHRLELMFDDVTFALAVAFAVTNSALLYRAVLAGLGRHDTGLSPAGLTSYFKLVYAGQLAGIIAMGSAKASVVMLFKRVAPSVHRGYYIALALTAGWAVFCFFSLAFQCPLPELWRFAPSRCPSRSSLNYAVIISNMVTDVIIAVGAYRKIWKLKMAKAARIKVIGLFGTRILVSLVAIGQIVAVGKSLHSADQTWASLDLAIWDQIVIHFSVITATIPRTNSFWNSLQTGKTGTYVTQEEYELSDSRGGSTGMFTKRSGSTRPKSNLQSNLRSQDNSPFPLVPPAESKVSTRAYASTSENHYDDFRSQAIMGGTEDEDSSQSSLKQRGLHGEIWRDVEVSIQVEDADTRSRSGNGVAF